MINNGTQNSEHSRTSGKQNLEANLLAIVENADGLIYSLDRDFRYITLNCALKRKLKDVFGIDAKVGDVTYDFLEDIDLEAIGFWKEIYSLALGGESLQFVKQFSYSGVDEFWRFSVNPIRQNGEITGLSCFAHDMTELRRTRIAMEKSEKKYRLIFNSNLLPSWVYDADTLQFIDVNEAAIKHYGYSREEFLSKTIRDICPTKDLTKLMEMISNRKHLERANKVERQHIKKNGEIIDVSVLTCPIEIDDKINILVLAEDITQRKEIEQAIHRLNEGLEEQVQQRTEQIKTAYAELEAFSYSVSHDLRSPLRLINGFIKILLNDLAGRINPTEKEYLEIIGDKAVQMDTMIRDMLKLSSVDKADLVKNEVDMHAMVVSVLEELNHATGGHNADINILELPKAVCDNSMVKQVWTNLISNAIKYSGKKPEARIEIGSTNINNETAYYVKDNGAGFDMKFAHKLFTAFQRLHNSSDFEGTGVGLALVSRIVSKHGGRIWADAKVDAGATFYFCLS